MVFKRWIRYTTIVAKRLPETVQSKGGKRELEIANINIRHTHVRHIDIRYVL